MSDVGDAMKVLVTGASGFVGRALVDRLGAEPGMEPRSGVRRPDAAVHNQVITPDLTTDGDWSPAVVGADAVVHLAARVHVMAERAADPLAEYRRANVDGTLRLARAAVAAGVKRFVLVSTVKVNGEATQAGHPFTEADPPAPTDPYGVSKAEAERALFDLGRASDLEVVVLRPTLVYGPGVKANFLAMTRWIARGVPLPFGSVTQNRRSLIAVDNLTNLIITCLRHPAAAGEVFLAADGEDLSTAALMCRVAQAMGRKARLIPVPASLLGATAKALGHGKLWQRLGGSLQVDTSKARSLLGWTPPISVNEGLRRAVAPIIKKDA